LGELEIFLPCAQEEAENCVADVQQQAEQSQLEMTVKRKLEQTFETAQADEGKENEHSEEWLNDFSQQAEKEAVALKLAAEEAKEQAGKFITPWEMELEMLEDWLNNPGPARELAEFELSEKRMTEQQVSQRKRLQS
jgi:hypothetical protein